MTEVNPTPRHAVEDRRLSGPIGDLVASTLARVLANFAGRIHERDILAVGPGSERAAVLFARGAAVVTAVQPSEAMLMRARQRATAELVKIQFRVGDPQALNLPDRSFDVAVGLRLLMHTPQWRRPLSELCRVAERLVIVDYFPMMSVSLVGALLRRLSRMCGGRSAPYYVVTHAAIVDALEEAGFRVRSVHRQFVLPLALHRAIGSRRFTARAERFLDRLGLVKRFGTPVTLVAERSASLNDPIAEPAAGRRR
jgi:SAM-dependent methyltransferase